MRSVLSVSLIVVAVLFPLPGAAVDVAAYPALQAFIQKMRAEHGFSAPQLIAIFGQVEIKQEIIDIMDRPGEAAPWHKYRQRFVTRPHARRGSRFWKANAATLKRAARVYGVDPEIIVAIIGVETQYGQNTGRFRTIDALTTLMLEYPRRSAFFRRELKHYLLLTREHQLDPLTITGSYAGAIGSAQFIPSSYRSYAVDFDGNGRADLFGSIVDNIGSIANYFRRHRWKFSDPVSSEVQLEGSIYPWLKDLGIEPVLSLKQLAYYGITPVEDGHDPDRKAALITLKGEAGLIYRLSYNNFYVITRYNHNKKYAMAVFELSRMIRQTYLRESS